MSSLEQSSVANHLLRTMPPAAFEAVAPHLEPCPLPLREMLARPNTPIPNAHFILRGLASTTVTTTGGRRLEIGIFGRDGISTPSVVLGTDQTPYETFMQAEGSSLRLPVAQLSQLLLACEPLRAFLLRYVQVLAVQTAHTALSNGSFNIEERTARWLLMCQDRIDGAELPITHEFLGIMLGVRRSSVTDSLHVLEGMGIIRARRGSVTVLDHARLERVAGESYGAAEAEYERLLGPLRTA